MEIHGRGPGPIYLKGNTPWETDMVHLNKVAIVVNQDLYKLQLQSFQLCSVGVGVQQHPTEHTQEVP